MGNNVPKKKNIKKKIKKTHLLKETELPFQIAILNWFLKEKKTL